MIGPLKHLVFLVIFILNFVPKCLGWSCLSVMSGLFGST